MVSGRCRITSAQKPANLPSTGRQSRPNRRTFMPNQLLPPVKKMMSLLLTLSIAMGPAVTPAFAGVASNAPKGDSKTATPIKHVIVIVGENRSFDHLFGTYVPQAG